MTYPLVTPPIPYLKLSTIWWKYSRSSGFVVHQINVTWRTDWGGWGGGSQLFWQWRERERERERERFITSNKNSHMLHQGAAISCFYIRSTGSRLFLLWFGIFIVFCIQLVCHIHNWRLPHPVGVGERNFVFFRVSCICNILVFLEHWLKLFLFYAIFGKF